MLPLLSGHVPLHMTPTFRNHPRWGGPTGWDSAERAGETRHSRVGADGVTVYLLQGQSPESKGDEGAQHLNRIAVTAPVVGCQFDPHLRFVSCGGAPEPAATNQGLRWVAQR